MKASVRSKRMANGMKFISEYVTREVPLASAHRAETSPPQQPYLERCSIRGDPAHPGRRTRGRASAASQLHRHGLRGSGHAHADARQAGLRRQLLLDLVCGALLHQQVGQGPLLVKLRVVQRDVHLGAEQLEQGEGVGGALDLQGGAGRARSGRGQHEQRGLPRQAGTMSALQCSIAAPLPVGTTPAQSPSQCIPAVPRTHQRVAEKDLGAGRGDHHVHGGHCSHAVGQVVCTAGAAWGR